MPSNIAAFYLHTTQENKCPDGRHLHVASCQGHQEHVPSYAQCLANEVNQGMCLLFACLAIYIYLHLHGGTVAQTFVVPGFTSCT